MIIKLNDKQIGSILPDNVLTDIQPPLYNAVYGLRHPLAIYNVACSTVIDNFGKTVNTLLRVIYERPFLIVTSQKGDRSLMNTLLAEQKDLLYGLMEYLDDCDNILACFFPSKDVRNKDTHVKLYRKATKEYREHIGKVVNYLKHNQGRLLDITFYNDNLVLPGYFVVGATEENAIGPVQMIHPDNTAFSFARDLRYNLFHFYAVAEHLSNAIGKILGKEHNTTTLKNETLDEKVLNIASRISNLPLTFYPDEGSKLIPNVIVSQDYHLFDRVITLAYPDEKIKVDVAPKRMKIIATHKGDGVTPSFQIPYMKNK
jgi:hypothetical protein